MSDTHELRLKINAAAAESGARRFTTAVEAVKRAVRDLERDSAGAFTKLSKINPQVDVTPANAGNNRHRETQHYY